MIINSTKSKKPRIFTVSSTPKGLENILSIKPEIMAATYCAIVNVSDSPCATFDYQNVMPSFWFPINELGKWTHAPFYGTMKVVNEYYTGNKKVFIHCHAGANRSPSVAFAVLLAKGYTWQEAEESLEYPNLYWVFQRNVKRGHIPEDVIKFLMGSDKEPTFSIVGVLKYQDLLLTEILNRKIIEQNNYDLSALGARGHLTYSKDLKKFIFEENIK